MATTGTPLAKKLRPNYLRVRLGPEGGTICRLHNTLEGLLAIQETRFLYRLARNASTVVEIGSFRGKSCVLMLEGAKAHGNTDVRITCIDPHEPTHFGTFKDEDHEAFEATIAQHGFTDRVHHLRMYSHDARQKWDGPPIDVLWVDGDHSYEGAKTDFVDWAPLVRPGGVIAAHDTYRERFPGCLKAWNEVIEASDDWGPTQRCRTIAWAVKQA
ncbi:MAG: hypothetical protein Tsb0013_22410 [Phycisphaerales bacterium]